MNDFWKACYHNRLLLLVGPYYDGDLLRIICDYQYDMAGTDILTCDASNQPGWYGLLPNSLYLTGQISQQCRSPVINRRLACTSIIDI